MLIPLYIFPPLHSFNLLVNTIQEQPPPMPIDDKLQKS